MHLRNRLSLIVLLLLSVDDGSDYPEASSVRREREQHLNAVKAADNFLRDNFQHPSPRLNTDQLSSFSKQQSPRYARLIVDQSSTVEGASADYNRPSSSIQMRPSGEDGQSVAADSTHEGEEEMMYDSDSFYDSRPHSSGGNVATSRPPSGARKEHLNVVKAADNFLQDNFRQPSPRLSAEQLSSFSKQHSPRYAV